MYRCSIMTYNILVPDLELYHSAIVYQLYNVLYIYVTLYVHI